MRKIRTLLLCIAMLFVLAACTADPATTGSTHGTYPPTSSTTKSTDPSSTPTTPAHSHEWVEASCTAPKTCPSCGATEGAPLDHFWDAGVVTKEATEETEGEKLYTCASCSTTRTEIIPVLDHAHNYDAVITDPTCTAEGYTTYTCRCGDSYTADETTSWGHDWSSATCTTPDICKRCSVTQGEALGHSWKAATCTEAKTCTACNLTHGSALGHVESVDAAVDATCTKTGLTEGSHCSVCNEVLVEQQIVSAKGHIDVIDPAIAPTCTESGFTEGKHCSVCSKVLVAQKNVSATGHSEAIDAAVAATCTKTGLTEGKHCSVCNKVLVAQKTVNATGHFVEWDMAIPPSCVESGFTEGKHCSACQEVLVAQQVIDALGHDWKNATCTVAKTCKRCNATDGVALGHTAVVDAAIAPSCTASGLTEGKHCSVCNKVLVSQKTVNAKGHDWKDATCTEAKTCLTCQSTSGSKLGHWWKDATCTEPQRCIRCQTHVGNPIGHIWQDATCTIPKKCKICNITEGTSNGHNWQEATCTEPRICTSCGASTGNPNGHRWLDAACNELIICQICSTENGRVQHSYVNGTCAQCNKLKPSEGLDFGPDDNGCIVIGIGTCKDTNIVIPDEVDGIPVIGIQSISDRYNREYITSIVIPSSITYIGSNAFSGCSALTSIVISRNSRLARISPYALTGCTNLTSIIFEGTIEQWNSVTLQKNWHKDVPECQIICLDGTVICQTQELDFREIDGGYEVSGIGTCTTSEVKIPAFYNGLPVISIGEWALGSLKNITSITLSPNITTIKDSAFANCENLSHINLSSVKIIGNNAFDKCCSLTSVVIPETVVSIGYAAFYGCYKLESITIPSTITKIGAFTFYDCNNLKTVIFNGTMAQWKAIAKEQQWDYRVPSTEVICADGKVSM